MELLIREITEVSFLPETITLKFFHVTVELIVMRGDSEESFGEIRWNEEALKDSERSK